MNIGKGIFLVLSLVLVGLSPVYAQTLSEATKIVEETTVEAEKQLTAVIDILKETNRQFTSKGEINSFYGDLIGKANKIFAKIDDGSELVFQVQTLINNVRMEKELALDESQKQTLEKNEASLVKQLGTTKDIQRGVEILIADLMQSQDVMNDKIRLEKVLKSIENLDILNQRLAALKDALGGLKESANTDSTGSATK
jgi:hypothetical protein